MTQQATAKRLLADSLVVFHDKRSTSRQAAGLVLAEIIGQLVVVQGGDDIQAVIEKLHRPLEGRRGIDAIITDLDPRVR